MREQLIQYVNLLFAGAPGAAEIRDEILQNTLERYDDLTAQGKTPEAAYRLAISGIGDINEILGNHTDIPRPAPIVSAPVDEAEESNSRKIRAVAVAMYILCPVPLFILSEFGFETLGLCMTLLLVAAATALMIMIRSKEPEAEPATSSQPENPLKKSMGALIWAIGSAVYFVVSLLTHAWYITWLVFPITACIQGLANAIVDLKEAAKNEK